MRIGSTVVEDIFSRAGAYLQGHFLLSSGKHSPLYLEKFQVLQWPQETERLCQSIAESARGLGVQTVAGPTTGGIILAHEVARQLGVRAVYAERAADGRGREFRRGFRINPGERVLVVDDIVSTGGSVQETIDAVRAGGGAVVGVGVLVDRSAGQASFDGLPLIALWDVAIPAYAPDACPQCAQGLELVQPGTTPAPAPVG
ncbi:MAG TPA: orotate phosphoribosyltransferase [Candidatus Limnocylindria bacterium]|nr:orotate phosphoribosyltransferase [Candidatus Limnocylindria bacterium]